MGNERGQALPLLAVITVVLLGMMGLAIDIGYTLSVRQALQASTDAAASAAAMELSIAGGNPSGIASQFAMTAGSKNARTRITGVSVSTSVKCTNYMANLMTGANCTSATTPANTVTVTQTAPVSTFFARAVGFTQFNVVTKSTAGMRGGAMPEILPPDVMCPPGDAAALSAVLSSVVSLPGCGRELLAPVFAHARRALTFEALLDATEAVYHDALVAMSEGGGK